MLADESRDVLAEAEAFLEEADAIVQNLRAERRRLVEQIAKVDRALAAAGAPWIEPGGRNRAAIAFVETHPGCTAREIGDATGDYSSPATLAVRGLVSHHKMRGRWHYYPKTEEPPVSNRFDALLARRERMRLKGEARRKALAAAGLCTRCGERPPEVAFGWCAPCRDWGRQYQRDLNARSVVKTKRAQGVGT